MLWSGNTDAPIAKTAGQQNSRETPLTEKTPYKAAILPDAASFDSAANVSQLNLLSF